MDDKEAIQKFEDKQIRTAWDAEQEKWYFSIVDVIAILTDSPNPQTYWRVMKKRLKDEGNETVTNCNGLKMKAADGKMRLTDVADTEQLLRLIQSIPFTTRRGWRKTVRSPSGAGVWPVRHAGPSRRSPAGRSLLPRPLSTLPRW